MPAAWLAAQGGKRVGPGQRVQRVERKTSGQARV